MLLMFVPLILFASWLVAVGQKALAPEPESKVLLKTLCGTFAVTITISLAFGVPGHWEKLERIADQRAMVQALAGKPQLPFGQVDILLDRHTAYVSDLHETNYVLYLAYKSTHWAALMVPEAINVRNWGSADRQLKLTQIANGLPVIASLNVMRDYLQNGHDCKTIIRVKQSELSAMDVLWKAEHQPQYLPTTYIEPVSTTCRNADEFWRQNQPSTSRSTYEIQAASN